ncbi:MAG: glutamine-hydrolyzing GMP synthase [Spirochaetaceae bacterium]|nr:MAG: glutamine-hydrolyzing GMP synthase [Spirochaetaceae bacterium]
MDTILILDFGSQTTQLIGRRIRDLGVRSTIIAGDRRLDDATLSDVKGIILSGSPASVADDDAPRPDPRIYHCGVPILGICYGLQRLVAELGGRVEVSVAREYGRSRQRYRTAHPLFHGVPDGFVSWMSHGDSIRQLPDGATLVTESEHGLPGCVAFAQHSMVGIQFHPEVTHCEYGDAILENFAIRICGARRQWTVEHYLQQQGAQIRKQVGSAPVLLLISGGVDSTVTAALLLQTLDPQQVHLMYVDTGLMRDGESEEVARGLRALGARHLYLIDAEQRFLSRLAGVDDPEQKRERIGDTFIEVQQEEVKRHIDGDYFLAQGTLYTDLIESGRGVGAKAKVIKSHHNVRSPLVEARRAAGRIVEPLAGLYKDEVRRLGTLLGVAPEIVDRHPFPGPGLAVRILGEVTKDKCDILRAVDDIYISQLRARGLYADIWQAFSVLLPVRSTGVTGDARGYGYVAALRAVVSRDGMTADVFAFPPQDLLEISALITNRVPQVGRVVYDVSSKPPATIEWE